MDVFEAKESKEALLTAVAAMPERERTVLTMYYYDGLTLTEIGDILGVTESRVCQIHTKALRQLRSVLAERSEAAARPSPAPESPRRSQPVRKGRAHLQLLAS
jgi:RNA polymerase sigma factor for flagellar operon FliA